MFKSKTSVCLLIVLSVILSSCDFFNTSIPDWFREYTDYPTVSGIVWSGKGKKDSSGVLNASSSEDFTVTLTMNNLQQFKFTPGENMILSFPEELTASALNTSVVKIKQDSSDLSKIVITYPADFLREAERGTKKFDISPKVVFKHPKIGIDFCTYDSFKVICNSAPTMPSGAVLYKDSSDNKYVICFNLPDKNAMKSGAKDSDIKKLRIDDTDYDIKVNADGTFSFSNPNFLQAPTPALANSNYEKVDSSHDFIPNGQPVYFKTSDSIGSNPVYKIEIFDETIGSGAVTVGASMLRLKEPEVSKKDSHDVFTSLNAAAENEIPVSSDGSSYVYITPPSEYATGGAVQDVSVVYELWRGHNKLEKISDGTVTAAQSPVAVPGGKTLLRVYAYKDGAADSSVKEYKVSVLIYAYYVKGEGASVLSGSVEDTNEGTKSYPLKTVHAAIQKINALPSATEQYTVFVDGSAAEDNAITVGGSSGGTSARKIEIKRLDSATAEIHRASAASPAGALFTVEKDSNLKFTNITIDGKNLSLSGNEMVSRGNIDFEGCLVQNYDAQSHHVLHIENGSCTLSDTVIKSTASNPQAYVYIDRTSSASPTFTVKKSVKIGGSADFSSIVLGFYEDSSGVKSAYITADGLSADSYINVVPYKYDKQFGKTLVKGANASSYKGYFHVAGSSEDGGRYFLEAGNDGGTDNALILKKSIVISGDEPNAWAKLKYNAENASDGETIVVTGTIKAGKTSTEINGTSFNNFSEIKISKNITIRANGTPAVIDADKTTDGKSAHRIFTVSGAGVKLTLQNVTLQGGIASGTGEAGYGGAVYVKDGTTLELKECNVKDNSATMGGGVYVEKGSFTLENSGVQNCQSSGGKKYGVYVKAYAGGGAQPVFKVKGAVKIGSASDSTAVCLGWDTDTGAVVTAQNLAAGAHINLVPENYIEQYGKALVRSTAASFPTASISSFSLTDAPAGKAVFRLMAGTASGTQSALLLRETVTIDGNADENAWAYLKYYSAHILPGDDIIVKNTVKAKVGGTVSINGVNEQTDGKIHVGSDVLIWAKGTGATLDAFNKDSIFEFDGTGSGKLTLKNLTLKNGKVAGGYNGGAVLVKSDKTLVLENCIIQDCGAGKGGALYIEKGGKCVLSGTTLSGNKASGTAAAGGAVYVEADSSKAGKLSISGTSVITKENDVGTDKYNDVCLETGAVITVTGTLSGSVTARITPKTYTLGRIVVQGEGFTLPSDYVNRFTVTEENGNPWNLEKDGNALKLKTSTLIVDGGAHTNDAWKFLKEQVQAAPENSTIIIKGTIKATAATGNNGAIPITKNITIQGERSGTSITSVLDAGKGTAGKTEHRIFAVVGENIVLTLKDVALENGKTPGGGGDEGNHGGAILIKQDAKCAITDCELSSSEAGDKGGAIYVEKGAECTITNTKIDGNKATGMGGGVYVEAAYGTAAAGKCVISGGSFTNNEANGGGGGAIYTAGTLAITSCTIGDTTGTNGNKATGVNGGGGGINIFKGTCTLTNVTMEGNTLAGNSKGSGVYLYSSAGSTTFTVKGATKIGSSTDTNAVLVVLTSPTQVAVNVDGLMDAHINLEPVSYNFQKNEELVKGDGASSYKGYFHLVGVPSGETWSLKPNAGDNGLVLRKQETIDSSNGGTWKKLKAAIAAADGGDVIKIIGEIKATNDTDNSGELEISKNLTIKGIGTAAALDANKDGVNHPSTTHRIFKVTSGKTLTLQDLTLKGGKPENGYGGGILLQGGTLDMKNCDVKGNESECGGGIYANTVGTAASSVTISGGTIGGTDAADKNKAVSTSVGYGGGIYVEGGSTLTMRDDAKVIGNTATQNGGGVYTDKEAQFNFEGGTISGNSAGIGKGVYIQYFTGTAYMKMSGGAKVDSNNDVHLGSTSGNPAFITVTGALSNSPAATLTMDNSAAGYAVGREVVKGDGYGYTLTAPDIARFPITAQTSPAQNWTTELDGTALKLKKSGGGMGMLINGADTDAWTKLKTEVENSSGSAKITIQGTVQATTAHKGEITVLRNVEIVGDTSNPLKPPILDAGSKNRIFKVTGAGAELTLKDLTLKGGNAKGSGDADNGGGIFFDGGSGVFSNCTIESCSSNNFGGAIALKTGAILEIKDNSHIKSCNAKNKGGGLYIIAGSAVSLINSYVEECHVTNNTSLGGGVWLESSISASASALDLSENSSITLCTAGAHGGAVYMNSNTILTMGKNAKVEVSTGGDKNKDGKNEIYFQGGEIKVMGTLSAGDEQAARITVYNPSDGKQVLTGDTAANCTKFAVTPNGTQEWEIDTDGKLAKKRKTIKNSDTNAWEQLKNAVSAAADGDVIIIDGEIKATTDTNNSGEIEITKKLTIQGKARALSDSLDANSKNRIFKVTGAGELTLQNLTLKGGNSGTDNGGIIYVDSGTKVTLSGCSIKSGSANQGGAFYVKGTLDIKDSSTINSCEATSNGGGIYIEGASAKCNLIGSKIIGCKTTGPTSWGGGVYMDNGAFTMEGNAEITSCSANNDNLGGGVYVAGTNCTFEMKDNAKVTVSTENTDGKNEIYLQDGKIKLTGKLSAGNGEAGRITVMRPALYKTTTQVLTGDHLDTNCKKFTVTPDSGTNWYVNADGKLTTTEP